MRIFLAMLALTGGCSLDSQTNIETGRRAQVLHIGNKDEPQEIDPHIVSGLPEWHIIQALFEGLVSKDPVDLGIVPGVAESWTLSEDRKTYIFSLRRNARWSNGDPISAQDYAYSWKRALMPALGDPYVYMFFHIRNAERFFRGEADFSEVGIKALDDHTLQVELEYPTPYFLQLLDHHSYYPVHRGTIEKFGAIDERGTRWTRPGNFVGNGPFVLKDWVLNRILIVEKNPYYWDADRVRLNGIHFYPVQNASTEERMYRAGQLHITELVPPEKIAGYRELDRSPLRITPYLASYFYRLNTTVKPLDDVRVRKALAMSIDREQIVQHIAKGGQQAARSLTPPGINGYVSPSVIREDPAQARRLLAEAGYPGGHGFPGLQITFNTDETHQKIAIAIQQMWKHNLGIDVTLGNQDWKVHLDRETNLQYQISRANWIGDTLDPTTFLELFLGGGGNNRTGWSHARYDELLAESGRVADQEQRFALLGEAESILVDEAPIIPIYFYTRVTLISPEVHGWHSNLLDQHPYKYLHLEAPPGA